MMQAKESLQPNAMSDDSTSSDPTLWMKELFGHSTLSINPEESIGTTRGDVKGVLPRDILVPASLHSSELLEDQPRGDISTGTSVNGFSKRKHDALTDHSAPQINNDLPCPAPPLSSTSRDTLNLDHVDYRLQTMQQHSSLSSSEHILLPFRQQDAPGQGFNFWIPPPIGQPGESRRSPVVLPPNIAALFKSGQLPGGLLPNEQLSQQGQDASFIHQSHQIPQVQQNADQRQRYTLDPSQVTVAALPLNICTPAVDHRSAREATSIEFLNHCHPDGQMQRNQLEWHDFKSKQMIDAQMHTMRTQTFKEHSSHDSTREQESQSTTFFPSPSTTLPSSKQQGRPPTFFSRAQGTMRKEGSSSTEPEHSIFPSAVNPPCNIQPNEFPDGIANLINGNTLGYQDPVTSESDSKIVATTVASQPQCEQRDALLVTINSTMFGALESASEESSVDTSIRREMDQSLPVIAEPRNQDVLLGRGHSNFMHPGNQVLRMLVDEYREEYKRCSTRAEKTALTELAVQLAKTHDAVTADVEDEVVPHGRFLEYSTVHHGWVEVDDDRARSKVSHLFRAKQRIRN